MMCSFSTCMESWHGRQQQKSSLTGCACVFQKSFIYFFVFFYFRDFYSLFSHVFFLITLVFFIISSYLFVYLSAFTYLIYLLFLVFTMHKLLLPGNNAQSIKMIALIKQMNNVFFCLHVISMSTCDLIGPCSVHHCLMKTRWAQNVKAIMMQQIGKTGVLPAVTLSNWRHLYSKIIKGST